jgi:hypothetical protein
MTLKNSMKQDECDRDTIIFNKGFESGQQHQHSSPETVRAIGDLKEKIDKIYFCLFGIAEDEQAGIVVMLKEIREQTRKTNGRVNALEGWRMYIVGGLAILTLIGLPMLWMLINDVRNDGDLIKSHIAQTK